MTSSESDGPRQRWDVCFSGRVQGVGFRYTVDRIARSRDVVGYVRNLPDGRVRLVAEGDREELDALVAAVREQMSRYIRNVNQRQLPATGEFEGFAIRH